MVVPQNGKISGGHNIEFYDEYVDEEYEYEEGEEEFYDEYAANAEIRILDVISQHHVVTDRELKIRLERDFFPWVVGRSLNSLVKAGEVELVGAPGRKPPMGTPENFFMDPELSYADQLPLIMRKRRVSSYVNSLLTRMSPAGYYAETVFERAFIALNFKILAREASEFGKKKVLGVAGKEPPNLDFIIRKDKLVYGVDIKNWIKEFDSVNEVMDKVDIAKQLEIFPFICARYVDKDTIYKKVYGVGGIVYRYETLILPPEFDSLATEARTLLGYPILVSETLPQYKLDFIYRLHVLMLKRIRKKKGN